jgi:hypothetical protein
MSGVGAGMTGAGGSKERIAEGRGRGARVTAVARQRYHCEACPTLVISYDLKHHYSSKTNWDQLEQLNKGVSKEDVISELGELDAHTMYMFKHGYKKTSLPNYRSHKMQRSVHRGPMDAFLGRRRVPEMEEDQEDSEDGEDQGKEEERKRRREGESSDAEAAKRQSVEETEKDDVDYQDDDKGDDDRSESDKMSQMEEGTMEEGGVGSRVDSEEERRRSGLELEEEIGFGSDSEEERREEETGEEERREEETGEEGRREEETGEDEDGRHRMSEADIKRVGFKIAEILEKKDEEKKVKEKIKENIKENWVVGDNFLVCRPCGLYSKGADLPPHLRSGNRGKSGTIQRKDSSGNMKPQSVLKKGCVRHEKNDIHIWCEMKESRMKVAKKSFDTRSEEAGLGVTRTVIKTLKRGGSSEDFMADLDLLSLTPGVVYAVKNNSRRAFFEIRDTVFEVVSSKMQTFFKENVKHIAVTLDKVTIHHVSYTVICTYFFWGGELFIVLNQLTILGVDDYDGPGTARMVITALCMTLGFSRTKLANTLRHFRYFSFISKKIIFENSPAMTVFTPVTLSAWQAEAA